MKMCTAVIALCLVNAPALAGSLTPPAGPVAPTPGPEPRIPINLTNTPGDADSIYKITAPGSYYLTGNVTGVAAKYGIEIDAGGVTVDLMGFELLGVVGSLDGVHSTGGSPKNCEVRNGSIRAWGDDGIDFGSAGTQYCRVQGIRAADNSQSGLRVASETIVTDCTASGNGARGIWAGIGCAISQCVASENATVGIFASIGGSVTGCVASYNGTSGMQASSGATFTGCSASFNTGDGFVVGAGCEVSQCAAYENDANGITASSGALILGCSVNTNQVDGIVGASDCVISGNACDSNGFSTGNGANIHVTGADNRIESNSCTDADRGIQVDLAGNIIVKNTCSGNTNNWDVVAGNFLLVIDATGFAAGAVSGNSGGTSPGSTNPNANFTY